LGCIFNCGHKIDSVKLNKRRPSIVGFITILVIVIRIDLEIVVKCTAYFICSVQPNLRAMMSYESGGGG
jgi:hypothetical protein